MRVLPLGLLATLLLAVGCGQSTTPTVAPSATAPVVSSPSMSPAAAIDQAAQTLAANAQKTKDEDKNGLAVKAYKLSGMTTAEAVAKLDPVLLPAGFSKREATNSTIVTYVVKGGMVMITNPDPVKMPDQFQMTTMVHRG